MVKQMTSGANTLWSLSELLQKLSGADQTKPLSRGAWIWGFDKVQPAESAGLVNLLKS